MYIYRWTHHILLLLLSCSPSVIEVTGGRILALFPHIGRSHFLAFEPYLHHLSAIGHEVVVYSHFPTKNPLANYTDVSLAGSVPELKDTSAIPPFLALLPFNEYLVSALFWPGGAYQCFRVMSSKPVQELIKSNENFDLVITELFNSDCFLPFVHKFQAPHITMSSSAPIPVALDRFGNPDCPAYFANLFLSMTDRMDFFERLSNTAMYIWTRIGNSLFYVIPNEIIARLNFGLSIPWLSEIATNTSLLLLNTHPVTHGPRPYVPNIIEVAGIHLTKPKKLPDDIKIFLDEAKNGVVYVSFGSLLDSEQLSSQKLEACIQTFARLKQKVLWKWKGEIKESLPNVMARAWIPQLEILSHPNVKAFVTHSGLLGTIEAIHNSVPVVTIPFFGDQYNNAKNIVQLGMGIQLLYSDLTTDNFLQAINQVINNSSYKENAVAVAKTFHDRPLNPMDTAVHWTEYVLRHRGAAHMQSAARNLYFFQYLLLDVLSLIFFIVSTLVGALYLFLKKICVTHSKVKIS